VHERTGEAAPVLAVAEDRVRRESADARRERGGDELFRAVDLRRLQHEQRDDEERRHHERARPAAVVREEPFEEARRRRRAAGIGVAARRTEERVARTDAAAAGTVHVGRCALLQTGVPCGVADSIPCDHAKQVDRYDGSLQPRRGPRSKVDSMTPSG
jgi:hypothetical protein